MLKLRVSHNREDVADLFVSSRMARRHDDCALTVISITSRTDAERNRVEGFIRDIYAEHYKARIQVDYPMLMSVRDERDTIHAAVGFRPAAHHPLFLERYLDQPIEAAVSAHQPAAMRDKISRAKIVEVGNLASAGCGGALFLFIALASFLHQQEYEIVTATGTKTLARQFRMAGIETARLAPARSEALAADASAWGTYYDTEPAVMFGAIKPGVDALRRVFAARYELRAPNYVSRLHPARTTLL